MVVVVVAQKVAHKKWKLFHFPFFFFFFDSYALSIIFVLLGELAEKIICKYFSWKKKLFFSIMLILFIYFVVFSFFLFSVCHNLI